MKKRQMRKDEIKKLSQSLEDRFNISISKKDQVEMVDDSIILIKGEPSFFLVDNLFQPLLKRVMKGDISIKKVTVDMGAIKFVTSGADVMRPGITQIDDGILTDDTILIVDETHAKPLALGKALDDSDALRSMEKGKAIVIIHHVGDRIWNEY